MKKQKGITLIALIITIIVMIILVAVTINIAVNGGLIGKAGDAAKQTQYAADKEELQMAVIGARNYETEKIVESELRHNLDGWNITKNSDGSYTCISPNNNTFKVTDNGIDDPPPPPSEDDLPYTFYLGDIEDFLNAIDNENEVSEAYANAQIGFIVTDQDIFYPGFVYYNNEPTQIDVALMFMSALVFNKSKFVDDFTIEVNGEEITYDRVLLRGTSLASANTNYVIGGYFQGNNLYLVVPEYNENDYSSQTNVNITEYTALTPWMTLTKGTYKTAESLNYNIYKMHYEQNSEVIADLLVALNPTNTKVHRGSILYDETYVGSGFPCTDLPIYEENFTCVLLDSYTAQMDGGGTKTFSNVIMTTQHMHEFSVTSGGEPIGYLDGDNFVELTCSYDSSNRDANGYPAVYTTLEETGVVYTKE